MMETQCVAMAAATPAKLRAADGTAQRLVPPAAVIPTLTARATVMNQPAATARSQDLKAAMMETQCVAMAAAIPAKLRAADGTAQRRVPPAALMRITIAAAMHVVMGSLVSTGWLGRVADPGPPSPPPQMAQSWRQWRVTARSIPLPIVG